jgi:cytochrome c oxidase subunit 2
MTGLVHVMTKADFAAWKAAQAPARPGAGPASLAARGRELFTRKGCISCHAPGGPVRAPDLNGVYMRREGLRSGEAVLADENYLRESILNPRAKIVEGYDAIMPSFQGQLSEEDLLALIEYLKSRQYGDRPGK